MTLPQLPTDNLYKFLAIGALAVCVVSVVYPESQVFELESRVLALRVDTDTLNLEVDELGRLTQEAGDALRARRLDLRIKTALLKGKSAQAELVLKQIKSLVRVALIGGIVGAAGTVLGFWLWYWRVQRPQDLLLKRQMLEAQDKT